jgi:GNAT superfamily N-acetyltransferase
MAAILITNTRADLIPQLVELQIICYPTLADSSRLKAPHFDSHLRIFPEGQWVALDGERVVGMSAGFLYTFDFDHPHHTFDEIIGYGFFTHHDPQGQHFYGADVSVHPDYRRRGISRRLYDARKELVRQRGLRGIVTGAMIPGFADHKAIMDAHTYVAASSLARFSIPLCLSSYGRAFASGACCPIIFPTAPPTAGRC